MISLLIFFLAVGCSLIFLLFVVIFVICDSFCGRQFGNLKQSLKWFFRLGLEFRKCFIFFGQFVMIMVKFFLFFFDIFFIRILIVFWLKFLLLLLEWVSVQALLIKRILLCVFLIVFLIFGVVCLMYFFIRFIWFILCIWLLDSSFIFLQSSFII